MINVLYVRASVSASRGRDNVARPFRVAQSLLDDSILAHLETGERVVPETLQVNLQPYFPQGRLTTRRDGLGLRVGSTFAVNLPIIRELMHYVTALVSGVRWARRSRGEPRVMLLMTNFPPVAFALRLVSRLTGSPRVVTLTDLADFSYSPERVASAPWWKRRWLNSYAARVRSLERSYDGYVLLTAQMSELVNTRRRPHVVVEGVLNTSDIETGPREDEGTSRILAHAGTLDQLYGIPRILDAFASLNDPNAELWLFGTGDMDREIESRLREDPRIKFFGFQPRPKVFKALREATLLLNLRDPADAYTKFSFPSKLLEYMASGTPVLTTPLPGIPADYEEHLYFVDATTPEAIAAEVERLLALPSEELRGRGERAQHFVMTMKTADGQCPRVEELLAVVAQQGRGR